MARPFEDLARLDRLVHEPARLAILTALSACESADFLFLQRLTALTKGNLSAHLSKLEEAGLVSIEKAFAGKKTRTTLRLLNAGREAVDRHWRRLDALRRQTRTLLKTAEPAREASEGGHAPSEEES
jgi:DNA-binding MarR family transcriptional regulator